MGNSAGIILIPLAVVVGVICAGIYRIVRQRQFARMRQEAPDDFVFTFTATGWYQAAIVELRQRGMLPPETRTDSEDPFRRGPHWVAASPAGLRVMRGFDSEPTLILPWTHVGSITRETRVRRGYNNGVYTTVTINVRSTVPDVGVVLSNPDSSLRVWSTSSTADQVFAELNRLRSSKPGPGADKPRG